MRDFLTFLLGVCIGAYIGMIALAILMDKNYQKFCPECGGRSSLADVRGKEE